jgi:hypothetical protein
MAGSPRGPEIQSDQKFANLESRFVPTQLNLRKRALRRNRQKIPSCVLKFSAPGPARRQIWLMAGRSLAIVQKQFDLCHEIFWDKLSSYVVLGCVFCERQVSGESCVVAVSSATVSGLNIGKGTRMTRPRIINPRGPFGELYNFDFLGEFCLSVLAA